MDNELEYIHGGVYQIDGDCNYYLAQEWGFGIVYGYMFNEDGEYIKHFQMDFNKFTIKIGELMIKDVENRDKYFLFKLPIRLITPSP